MSVLFFSKLLSGTFLILRRSERCVIRNVSKYSYQVPFFCQILMKLELYRHIFENTQIKFHENPSSGSRIASCGQTDGRADRERQINATWLIVPYFYVANTPN